MEVNKEVQMLVWGLMEWMRLKDRYSLFTHKGAVVKHRLKAAGFTHLCGECLLPCGQAGEECPATYCPDCHSGVLERL